ncbi:hypothetical protein AVEN_15404-1 [Araneus ventricosus]|uniref:Uncharacterized protein n=1 Tax=Araneus ventricosus TaxID=182803 RepID=A0A4Y2CTM5_ARAVE|nr:hypothetical protein AVEN_15404-1 [Araneus ventricosus]
MKEKKENKMKRLKNGNDKKRLQNENTKKKFKSRNVGVKKRLQNGNVKKKSKLQNEDAKKKFKWRNVGEEKNKNTRNGSERKNSRNGSERMKWKIDKATSSVHFQADPALELQHVELFSRMSWPLPYIIRASNSQKYINIGLWKAWEVQYNLKNHTFADISKAHVSASLRCPVRHLIQNASLSPIHSRDRCISGVDLWKGPYHRIYLLW